MIGPFALYLDHDTGLWQLLPFDGLGGKGGGVGLGSKKPRNVNAAPASVGMAPRASREDHKHDTDTAAPVAVSGPGNAEGTADSLARSDHAHRLELMVYQGGTLVGARPGLSFVGPGLVVSDDPDLDVVTVTTAADGLGTANAAGTVTLTPVSAPCLATPFAVPPGIWEVELYASATVAISHPGTPGAEAVGGVFNLEVAGETPLTTRQLITSSVDPTYTELSLSAHGTITLGEGSYTAELNAYAMLVPDADVGVRWRYLGVRLLRFGV
ncbi:hypothetical protein [Nannocystis bainbridge]|uniref:Minor tail protein n=1 Tax=Nannocystis bainbridge TaxID=2995303 RepID=A0ABT5E3M5_9BACT|nr:hypothetical protein [Nannocystis bainbridge]MDC0719919.1 hypothetical protein [Nannocystis bainbridge]